MRQVIEAWLRRRDPRNAGLEREGQAHAADLPLRQPRSGTCAVLEEVERGQTAQTANASFIDALPAVSPSPYGG